MLPALCDKSFYPFPHTIIFNDQVQGSILIGIMVTALALFAIHGDWPTHFLSLPSLKRFDLDFSAVLAMEVKGLQVNACSVVLNLKGVLMF